MKQHDMACHDMALALIDIRGVAANKNVAHTT